MVKALQLLSAGIVLSHSSIGIAQQGPVGPQIEIRHARETTTPGFVHMTLAFPNLARSPMRAAYVETRAIVGDNGYREVLVSRSSATDLHLTIVLTPEAAARMVTETRKAVASGGHLALLIGSRLVSAAPLLSVIGEDPDLPILITVQLPDHVATLTAARIARRWPR